MHSSPAVSDPVASPVTGCSRPTRTCPVPSVLVVLAAAVMLGGLSASALAMPPRPVPHDEHGMPVAAGQAADKSLEALAGPGVDAPYHGNSPPRTGTANLPVLLIDFPDRAGVIAPARFDTMLFHLNQAWPTGSMSEYFRENGTLSIWGQTHGWFRMPAASTVYVNGFGGMLDTYPRNSQGAVFQAAQLADPAIDFSQYDNDGPDNVPNSGDDDGFVDCVIAVFAGYAAESYVPASAGNRIWSHCWYLDAGRGPGPYVTNDMGANGQFIKIDLYTIQSELRNTSGTIIRDIGVFCHEFGHALGLPDLWSTCPAVFQSTHGVWNGVGEYDLMCLGGWGAGGAAPDQPHHLSAFGKALLGWANTIYVSVDLPGCTIPAVQSSRTVYSSFPFLTGPPVDTAPIQLPPQMDLLPPPFEGWILENRQSDLPGQLFDRNLPGSGLLLYHYDGAVGLRDYDADGLANWYDNDVQWSERWPLLAVECPDQTGPDHSFDNDDLALQNNNGDQFDFFYQGNPFGDVFDWNTSPSNLNHSGAATFFALRNVGPSGTTMTADIIVGTPGGPNHDIWVKDCDRDDGSEPSTANCDCPGYHRQYSSPDVWFDNDGDGRLDAPVGGCPNRMFLKVRNAGPQPIDYATVQVFEMSGYLSLPQPVAPPVHPFSGMARLCSTTVASIGAADSATVQVWVNMPVIPPGSWPPHLGILVQTAVDTLTGFCTSPDDNNLAESSSSCLYWSAGQPAPKSAAATAASGGDLPSVKRAAAGTAAATWSGAAPPSVAQAAVARLEMTEPIQVVVPVNNPFEAPLEVTIAAEAELPLGCAVEFFLPEIDPAAVVLPYTFVLDPMQVTPLEVVVLPGEGVVHGVTGWLAILEYEAALHPLPEGLLGSMHFELGADLFPPLPVGDLAAELVSDEPCLPDGGAVRLVFQPPLFDVAGFEEDLSFFVIYRDTVPDVEIDIAKLIGKCAADADEETAAWEWVDPEWALDATGPTPYYRVVAVDEAGNASEASAVAWPELQRHYLDHDAGAVRVTFTDQGSFGWMEPNGRGSGFQYPQASPSLLYAGGLWVGAGADYVASRDYLDDAADWESSVDPAGAIRPSPPEWLPPVEPQGLVAWYRDTGADAPGTWLVRQASFAWSDPAGDDFVLVNTKLINTSDAAVTGAHAAVFADWDVVDAFADEGGADEYRDLIYCWHGSGPYVGIRVLHPAPAANLSHIHNPTWVWPNSFLSDGEKWNFMVGSDPAHRMRTTHEATDWSMVAAAGPFSVAPDDTMDVWFALVAGPDLPSLLAHADEAFARFVAHATFVEDRVAPLPRSLVVNANVPNPFNPVTEIRYVLPQRCNVEVAVFDLLGRRVDTVFEGMQTAGPHAVSWCPERLPSGTYLARVRAAGDTGVRKMVLIR
ncbi:MAG: M6 family metalloprotease domain-containing protein [Candidatus Krumholzibacteriia bacterium]